MTYKIETTVDGEYWVTINPENGTPIFRTEVDTFEDAINELSCYQTVHEQTTEPQDDNAEFN